MKNMTKMHYFSVIVFALAAALITTVCEGAPRDNLPWGDSIYPCFSGKRAQLDGSSQIMLDWSAKNPHNYCAAEETVSVCRKNDGTLSVKCPVYWVQVPKHNTKHNIKHKKISKKSHHKS